MPGAINLPLMMDDERAAVGTCYKRQGADAALALGHRLVCGDIRQQRLEARKPRINVSQRVSVLRARRSAVTYRTTLAARNRD